MELREVLVGVTNTVVAWRKSVAALTLTTGLSLGSFAATAAVLSEQKVLVPLTTGKQLALSVETLDPDEPYWVSMSLIALSDRAEPSGEVRVEMFPDGIPLPISVPQQFTLAAEPSSTLPRSDKLKAELDTSLQALPEGELEEALGEELVQAMKSYSEGGGQAVGKTFVVRYPSPHHKEMVFWVKVKSQTGDVHPLVLQATLGQGDIPAKYLDFFASANAPADQSMNPRALLAIGSLIFLAFAYLFRRWRG